MTRKGAGRGVGGEEAGAGLRETQGGVGHPASLPSNTPSFPGLLPLGGNPLSVGTAEHGAHKAGPWVCPSIPAPGSAAAAGGGFLGGSPAARD